MNNKTTGYKISLGACFAVIVGTYFLPFFKLKFGNFFGSIGSELAGIDLDIFSPFEIIKQLFADKLDESLNLICIFCFFIPMIFAVFSIFIPFLPGNKATGIASIVSSIFGIIADIAVMIIFFSKSNDVFGFKISISDFLKFDIGFFLNILLFITCVVLAALLLSLSEKSTTVINDPVMQNDFQPMQPFPEFPVQQDFSNDSFNYGHDNFNYNSDSNQNFGNINNNIIQPPNIYTDPDDVTVMLDDHSKGFLETPALVSASLHCIKGLFAGTSFPIKNNEEIIIGRDPSQCHIVMSPNYKYVSKKHCSIKYSDGKYILKVFSSNGVFVNDSSKFSSGNSVSLSKGDIISIGNKEISFELK